LKSRVIFQGKVSISQGADGFTVKPFEEGDERTLEDIEREWEQITENWRLDAE